jgi:hypothetical protein
MICPVWEMIHQLAPPLVVWAKMLHAALPAAASKRGTAAPADDLNTAASWRGLLPQVKVEVVVPAFLISI